MPAEQQQGTGSHKERFPDGVRVCALALAGLLALALTGGAFQAVAAGPTAQDEAEVDIVFVLDNSDSTNENRYHMAQEIERIETAFQGTAVDIRYALLTFNGSVRLEQPFTDDVAELERAMHYRHSDSVERASDALVNATRLDWRPDAETVVVLMTDEDDDSSPRRRAAAVDALEKHQLVAISPEDEQASSCDNHSPPCDTGTQNELRTVADDVDGTWIAIENDTEVIVSELIEAVEQTVPESAIAAESPERPEPAPDMQVTDRRANRTTVAVGEPVGVEISVENGGEAAGEYVSILSTGGGILDNSSVFVAAAGERTVRLSHAFEEPGNYTIRENHVAVAEIEVVASSSEPNVSGRLGGSLPVGPAVLVLSLAIGGAYLLVRNR